MARLSEGETLEIAGYAIPPALADAINRVSLADLVPPPASQVHWFEVTTSGDDDLMPPSQKTVLQWRDAGGDIETSTVVSEQFWATQEIATAPPLIEATRNALTGPPA